MPGTTHLLVVAGCLVEYPLLFHYSGPTGGGGRPSPDWVGGEPTQSRQSPFSHPIPS